MNTRHETLPENFSINQNSAFFTLLGTEEPPQAEIRTETVYRRNKISVDRVIEYDVRTNEKLRILYYDYFNNEKIRAIDEFMPDSGKKYRTVNYVLYKSIDEYDTESGERIRTINYDIKNEDKITSIQEYDIETKKLIKITLYRRDGKTISSVKEINPKTEHVTKRINFNEYGIINSISKYNPKNGKANETVCFYKNGKTVKEIYNSNLKTYKLQKSTSFAECGKLCRTVVKSKYEEKSERENTAELIDSLYNKKLSRFII